METRFSSTDPGRAEAESTRAYYPLSLRVLERRAAFRMSMAAVQAGPVKLGDLSFGADVALHCGELTSSYHVNMPLTGVLETEHRGEVVEATPQRAAVYHPTGGTVLRRWPGDCRQLCVKIDRATLDAELAGMLGYTPGRAVELAPTLGLTTGPGRSWSALVRTLAGGITDPDALVGTPGAQEHLARAVVSGLLLAVPHSSSEQLHGGAGACRPRVVKRVMDAIDADPSADLAVTDLARIAGVGVRALQAGFAEHVGTSPTAYLRSVRLARAHADLAAADPATVTVADVARRWGFAHLGRFAGTYRRAYGCSPSETLRA